MTNDCTLADARLNIVQVLQALPNQFPWRITVPAHRYDEQESEIARWLRDSFGGSSDGLQMHEDGAHTTFTLRPEADFVTFGRGTYFFKDKAWGAAFRLFFG